MLTDSLEPVYEQNSEYYLLNFDYNFKAPDTTIDLELGIKFLLSNNDSISINKKFFMLHYPYKSTSLVMRWKDFVQSGMSIQGFVYKYPFIYYHPVGPGDYLDTI